MYITRNSHGKRSDSWYSEEKILNAYNASENSQTIFTTICFSGNPNLHSSTILNEKSVRHFDGVTVSYKFFN
jgi:hypothetical protein